MSLKVRPVWDHVQCTLRSNFNGRDIHYKSSVSSDTAIVECTIVQSDFCLSQLCEV